MSNSYLKTPFPPPISSINSDQLCLVLMPAPYLFSFVWYLCANNKKNIFDTKLGYVVAGFKLTCLSVNVE